MTFLRSTQDAHTLLDKQQLIGIFTENLSCELIAHLMGTAKINISPIEPNSPIFKNIKQTD